MGYSSPMLPIQLTHEQCRVLVTEVGDRWAFRLDSWCLSSGVKLKFCSHPDTARTKLVTGAELCWRKEIRRPLLRSRKTSLCTCTGKLLGGQKGRGSIHNNVDMYPQSSVVGSILAKTCAHICPRRVLGLVNYGKRNKINIGVHVSLSDLVSSVCMPRSGIAV